MASLKLNGAQAPGVGQLGEPPAGMIIPSEQIRERMTKAIQWMDTKGYSLEEAERLWATRGAIFDFIKPGDPYNPYYNWMLNEWRAGRLPGAQSALEKQVKKPQGPPPPAEFRFSAKMPSISAKDLDVIKLTAQYTAKNGETWKRTLAQKMAGNPQFEFLRTQHSLHQFFTRQVDQYQILLNDHKGKDARLAELRRNAEDRFQILTRAKDRAQFVKHQELQRQKKEQEDEEERRLYASIDWHDFSVLATIVFDEVDERSELPGPTSLADLQHASLEQKHARAIQPPHMRIEEGMPWDENYWVAGQNQPTQPMPVQAPAPTVLPPTPVQMPAPPGFAPTPTVLPPTPVYAPQAPAPQQPAFVVHEDDDERIFRERNAERERARQSQAAARGPVGNMRIKENYVPRTAAKNTAPKMGICPNCKQPIPYDQMEEHMRIELLDPRWKEQRAKADSRYGTSNLSTADAANNLKRLASARDDVFDGVTGIEISEEEAARRKRAAMSYDGQLDPAKDAMRIQQMQSTNVSEQILRIQQKYKGNDNHHN